MFKTEYAVWRDRLHGSDNSTADKPFAFFIKAYLHRCFTIFFLFVLKNKKIYGKITVRGFKSYDFLYFVRHCFFGKFTEFVNGLAFASAINNCEVKKMKKFFCAVMLLAVAFTFVGCGGEKCDHTYSENYSWDDNNHKRICEKCDDELTEPHSLGEDGPYCNICGAIFTPTEGIEYELSEDGSFAIVKWFDNVSKRVRIADEYEGVPVKEISEKAFRGTVITEIFIPESVEYIAEKAFLRCYFLTNVHFIGGTKTIANDAFIECRSLNNIYVDSLKAWCEMEFGNEYSNPLYYAKNMYCNGVNLENLVINSEIKNIPDKAFENFTNLKTLVIGDQVESIGKDAFRGCNNLTSVSFGNGLITIGDGAFRDCINLKSVALGDSVTDIGSEAFRDCYNITELKLGKNLKEIGNRAFRYCSRLSKVTISEGTEWIGDEAFLGCSKLKELNLPNSLSTIGKAAFSMCFSLENLELNDGVRVIGDSAFYFCTALSNLNLGSSVTIIGKEAFFHCSGIVNLTIPESVITVDKKAFASCSKLESITVYGGLSTVDDNAFASCKVLNKVIFNGTAEEFEDINISSVGNEKIFEAELIFK